MNRAKRRAEMKRNKRNKTNNRMKNEEIKNKEVITEVDTEDYPYTKAIDFMQDEYKMEQLARGCIATIIDTSWFEELALQSIKNYAGELGIGYPKENEEFIEESFHERDILELMQNYIINKLGIANRY